MNSGVTRRQMSIIVAAIFLLAVALRVAIIVLRPQPWAPNEMARVARSLLTTGMFADPYVIPTGPTAHVAPFGALIVTVIYRIFGIGPLGDIVSRIGSALATACLAALMPWLSLRLRLGLRTGVVAGLIVALPLSVSGELTPEWEAAYVALTLMILFAFTVQRPWAAAIQTRAQRLRGAAILGIGWGLAFHLAPTGLPVLIALLGCAVLLPSGGRMRDRLLRATMTGAVAALVCLPWAIRNYRQLGAIVFVRDNFGLELSVGNNDSASVTESANFASGGYQSHPSINGEQAALVRVMGEIPYNRMRLRETTGWIRTHRSRFARLTAGRVKQFWFPRTPRPMRDVAVVGVTIAALAGLVLLFRTRLQLAVAITAVLFVFPLIYYVLMWDPRYSHPIWWLRALLAGYFCSVAWRWLSSRRVAGFPLPAIVASG